MTDYLRDHERDELAQLARTERDLTDALRLLRAARRRIVNRQACRRNWVRSGRPVRRGTKVTARTVRELEAAE